MEYLVHFLGDMWGIPTLQNAVIDSVLAKRKTGARQPVPFLITIYNGTAQGSQLRRLFVDWAAYGGNLMSPGWFSESTIAQYPQQFLVDLIQVQYQIREGTKARTLDFNAQSTPGQYYEKL